MEDTLLHAGADRQQRIPDGAAIPIISVMNPFADLARVSPLAYAHVIPSGTYHFEGARPG